MGTPTRLPRQLDHRQRHPTLQTMRQRSHRPRRQTRGNPSIGGSSMIPETVIEAATKAYRAKVTWINQSSRDDYGREVELGVQAALEASLPRLLDKAWDEGFH